MVVCQARLLLGAIGLEGDFQAEGETVGMPNAKIVAGK